jgi:S1-C subfamily serine protease
MGPRHFGAVCAVAALAGWFALATVDAGAQPPPGRTASRTSQRRTEIVDAAEKVAPAIVSVGASRTGYVVNPYADFFQRHMVYPYTQKIPYLGSGVIVTPDGLVVTNHHVVDKAEDLFVTLMDGSELKASLVDADPLVDIAILRVEGKNLPTVPLGDSDGIMVGEWALAMGNPFGNLIGDPKPTVTVGVVSATGRSFRPGGDMARVYNDMIQTDAAINPGNSGGALLNSAGELIGLNTFIMSRSGGSEGVGFAIPSNRVKGLVDEVLKFKRIRSKLVDFAVQTLDARIAKLVGASAQKGVVVSEMVKQGPAQRAGLQVGDVVVKVDGRPVEDASDFNAHVWTQPVGAKVRCEVDRGGRRLNLEYEITEPVEKRRQ